MGTSRDKLFFLDLVFGGLSYRVLSKHKILCLHNNTFEVTRKITPIQFTNYIQRNVEFDILAGILIYFD